MYFETWLLKTLAIRPENRTHIFSVSKGKMNSSISASTTLRLYRHILREHRRLPEMMRKMGDEYVKNEFRLHKSAKPEFVEQFSISWTNYLAYLKKNKMESMERYGKELSDDVKRSLNDEQYHRLQILKERTFKNDE
jgi:hypothetical protein